MAIPFWADEHSFASYFDAHQGYKVLTHGPMATQSPVGRERWVGSLGDRWVGQWVGGLVCWVGESVSWLVGEFVGWLVGWLVGRWVGWLVSWSGFFELRRRNGRNRLGSLGLLELVGH